MLITVFENSQKASRAEQISRAGHMQWASEGFFPGGPVGDFPKIFSRGEPKAVKFVFYPSKLKKQPFFANSFKIQGGQGPPLPLPSDAHGHMRAACLRPLPQSNKTKKCRKSIVS